MSSGVTRRQFVKASAATLAATALSSSRVLGANERVRVGFVGVGNRGGQLIDALRPHQDADIVALCDVYGPHLQKWAQECGSSARVFRDFRRMLDLRDLDAVFVATPDHWHAIQTIDACDAGKDVYIEKPLCMTVKEGRRMVEAARRNDRVVQVGVQRRSSRMFADLADVVRRGVVGKVTVARAYRITNMYPSGIGRVADGEPPDDLDWDMWLGPRPKRPFRANIAPYKFRWWDAYSSQLGNWGVHYFDLLRWLLDEDAPASVSCHGGRFAVDDDRTIPDTLQATYQFASGRLLLFGQYEASGASPFARNAEVELRGTLGTVFATSSSYEIVPETAGQFGDPKPLPEPARVKADEGDLTVAHIRDFLDCVKTRQRPRADVEVGHRSSTFSHLGNIALALEARVEWDAKRERFTSPNEANKLLHYDYRKPWRLG